ncbi:MAG TPA: PadR family transcriptional regulator [Pseudonocardiaceae bacterium]|nr:PadR family transcriptional regulator [Pseudonocardiaceae bacterium]
MEHPFEFGGHHDPRRFLKEHLRARLHGGGFDPHVHEGRGRPGFGPGPVPPIPPIPGFGPGFGFGFDPRVRGRGRRGHGPGRARRGNVRAAVLLLLAERPMHGYEIIQQISERSHGWWKPSPGSVYPTLQLLADEGLVTTAEEDGGSGKRPYTLTDEGRAEAEKQGQTPPWEQVGDDVDPSDVQLHDALRTLAGAAMQVSQAGTPELRERATKLLVETRRQLYLLLADAGTAPEDAVPED